VNRSEQADEAADHRGGVARGLLERGVVGLVEAAHADEAVQEEHQAMPFVANAARQLAIVGLTGALERPVHAVLHRLDGGAQGLAPREVALALAEGAQDPGLGLGVGHLEGLLEELAGLVGPDLRER
jgi:hypothetical protein